MCVAMVDTEGQSRVESGGGRWVGGGMRMRLSCVVVVSGER